jgi:hypothetical protein
MVELYTHSFPRIFTKKPKDGGAEETQVWGHDYNCFEEFEVGERQWERDDRGDRKLPPVVCPHCLLIEWVIAEIGEGRISWTDLLFKFRSDSAPPTKIYAGGLVGMFNERDLNEDDKKELKEKEIYLNKAFQQVSLPRRKNIYCVAELTDIEKGLQATLESGGLGSALSAAIDQRKEVAGDKGDPQINPYAFRWRYQPKALPADKYTVIPMPEVEISKAVLEAVSSEKLPPVFAQLRKYPNLKQLRATMEEGLVLKGVPLDQIFAPAMKLADKDGWVKDEEDQKADSNAASFNFGANAASGASSGAETNVQVAACSNCEKNVPIDATKCPHCGASFDDESESAEDVPPPKAAAAAPGKPPETPKALAQVAAAQKPSKGRGQRAAKAGGASKGPKVDPNDDFPPSMGGTRDPDEAPDGDAPTGLPWETNG